MLSRGAVLDPSDRHDPLLAARDDVIAVQLELSHASLLAVDVQDGLSEGRQLACDEANADIPGLRDESEDPGPSR
jgi:hypothetical protein